MNYLRSVNRSSGVKTWIFSLNFGLQPEQFHSSHFDWLFLGPDFVFPVFSAGEAVY